MTYCAFGQPVRVNPARAGMIRRPRLNSASGFCKPRACGDDPAGDCVPVAVAQ